MFFTEITGQKGLAINTACNFVKYPEEKLYLPKDELTGILLTVNVSLSIPEISAKKKL